MSDITKFALLGVGTGAIYTLQAQGVVVIYRSTGILNFALGAYATVGAYLFVELQTDAGMSSAASTIIAVVAVAALGAATYNIVIRPLADASPLAKVIATLGVLIALQSAVVLRYGSAPILYFDSMLPRNTVTLLGATIAVDRLWLLAIATGLTIVLWAGYRFTAIGRATTASAENPEAAAALGWSPHLIGSLNWALGTGLAAISAILLLPILVGVDPNRFTLIFISALAVALIGRFRSFPLLLVGGLFLGISEAETARYLNPHVQGASTAVPLLIIVLFLVVRGQPLPVRGSLLERLPRVGTGVVRPRIVLVLAAATAISLLTWTSRDLTAALMVSLTAAVVLLSIVVLTGYAGQLSLGQYALAGIGAWMTGRIVATTSIPFELALVIGVAGTIPVGLLFALPALRTRGINLAIVTLGLGLAVQTIIFANADYTGGFDGTRVGGQTFLGIDIDPINHQDRYTLFVLFWLVVTMLAVANLRRSRSGRRMLAVRANERAAASLGVSVTQTKFHAFAVSAAIASLGGVLLAFQARTVLYLAYSPFNSILAVAHAVIGGLGFVVGPLFGGTLAQGGIGTFIGDKVTDLFGGDSAKVNLYLALAGGLTVIAILIVDPNGLASHSSRLFRRVAARFARSEPETEKTSEPVTAPSVVRVPPASLEVRDLTVRFGGIVAVDNVDLRVEPGSIVGLIGPNGAGKTTIIDAICGYNRPSSGTVLLDGVAIERWPVHKRARAGIARTFQNLELFDDITVRENLLAASDRPRRFGSVLDLVAPGRLPLPEVAAAAVQAFRLGAALDLDPEALPYGQRRLVAIARAVAMRPSILLLDEPAAGLDTNESAEFSQAVRRLADAWGMGILLVEHDMDVVMGVCDRIVVVDFGRKLADDDPASVRADPLVVGAYLGTGETSDVELARGEP